MKAAIITVLFSGSLSLAGTPISFQRLPAGDSIFVTVTSSGCFHHYTHEFIFSHGATLTAKVTQVEHRWNEALKRQEEAKRIPLGTATLS